MLPERIKVKAERAGRWAAVALGASIPVSVALDGVLLGVILACMAVGAHYRRDWEVIRVNPPAILALGVFTLLAIGTFYGNASVQEATRYLTKYNDLLFIPLFVVVFRSAEARRAGIYALAGALLATVLLSCALRAGMPRPGWFVADSIFHVPFKHKLTHAVLVAFAAFLFFQLALVARSRSVRAGWAIATTLSLINLAFVVPGGTGYLVAGSLLLYTGYALWRYRGLVAMILAGALSAALLYQASDLVHERVDRAINEYSTWNHGNASGSGMPTYANGEENSIGLRLTFYRVTLRIIRDHPFMGVGTGGFPEAYAARAGRSRPSTAVNPHNEYLLFAAQLGLVGLLALLALFYFHWHLAPRLATPLETHLARGLLLTIAVGCLFNSFLLDHTEGLLFAWMTGLLYGGLQVRK
jgi:O-antigen ligase